MSGETILVVDDEPKIVKTARAYLESAGFRVVTADDGQMALTVYRHERPALVVLDLGLPVMDGLDVARALRRDSDVPIIMLTARVEETDRLIGLELGADDYVTKPFSPRELIARINAVLRRSGNGSEEVVAAEGLELDAASHRVRADGNEVSLGPTEFRLLRFFMTHRERVYSRDQLLDRVWGGNVYVEERTVDVHIRRLRKALEARGYDRFIQTVRGAGYRFSTQTG
jgi:two-component system phosphate regulon response regulator PhoB